jgi:hypothetical protein
MEAHASRIRISADTPAKPRRGRLRAYLAAAKARRRERAIRAHALRMNGVSSPSIPGSEHTHLLGRRGY